LAISYATNLLVDAITGGTDTVARVTDVVPTYTTGTVVSAASVTPTSGSVITVSGVTPTSGSLITASGAVINSVSVAPVNSAGKYYKNGGYLYVSFSDTPGKVGFIRVKALAIKFDQGTP
jgi:hypothetical protein